MHKAIAAAGQIATKGATVVAKTKTKVKVKPMKAMSGRK